MKDLAPSLEPLEARIAPATLLPGGKVVTYTDFDGDSVMVKFSKPIVTAGNAASIFIFAGSTFASTGPQNLASLQLATLGGAADKLDITITAKRSATTGGNGTVDISGINASDVNPNTGMGAGIDLGRVIVKGNLDYLDAGDGNLNTPALALADLATLGATADGASSTIHGSVGTFKVRGSMLGRLEVDGFNGTAAQESVKSLLIGGSLGPGFDSSSAGFVSVAGNLVSAKIGRNIEGHEASNTGVLKVGGDLGSLTVGGSIIGGTLLNTGLVQVTGTIQKMMVRGDVVGGGGPGSGFILAGAIGTASILGDVRGYIEQGGLMLQHFNGGINVSKTIASLTIGGSLIAGSIVAGIDAGADGFMGTADDTDASGAIVSKISKLIIKGGAFGTATAGDGFGIEANQIAMAKIGSVTYLPTDPLLSFSTGVQLSPRTADMKLRTL